MNLRDLFLTRASVPELKRGLIHVWQVSTAPGPLSALDFRGLLDSEERERADRFYFERDRQAFSVCRGLLRTLLGIYTRSLPKQIAFNFGPQGKPSLKTPSGFDIRFNVSHSGELGMFAFAMDREIGVDVEFKRAEVDFVGLARSTFSRSESSAITPLLKGEQSQLFYEYWTCKEACIKADGRGISIPLDRFSIVPIPEVPSWRAIQMEQPPVLSPTLRIRILDQAPEYAAAVAAEGKDWEIEHDILTNEAAPK